MQLMLYTFFLRIKMFTLWKHFKTFLFSYEFVYINLKFIFNVSNLLHKKTLSLYVTNIRLQA